jgi:hypothetical protein
MSTEKSIKEIIRDEYLKSAADPIYFLKKFVYIQTSEGRMLFTPYLFQEKLLFLLNKHDRTLILKSRQLGITTLTAAYALWLMIFKKDPSKTIFFCFSGSQLACLINLGSVESMFGIL